MDIDRCNSIFELFAAFNFTYAILSDISDEESTSKNSTYVGLIDGRLLKSFSRFLKRGNTLLNNVNTKTETVKTIIENEIEPNRSKLNKINGKYDNLKDLCEVWLKEIEDQKEQKKKNINEIFPFLSFYLATFCISVLGISISQSEFKHFSLFVLVIYSIIIFCSIFRNKSTNSYISLAKNILFGVFCTAILHFIIGYCFDKLPAYLQNITLFFDKNKIAQVILILCSLLLPFSHFIYYFFSINYNNNKIEKERLKQMDNYEDQYKKLNEEIKPFL